MNRVRLYHPVWTHLPALLLYGWILLELFTLGPLPDRVPVHFGLGGQADNWGSPWVWYLSVPLVPLLALGISFAMDEFWARQERRKRFNWITLFDEAMLGILAGVFAGCFQTLRQGGEVLHVPWLLLFSVTAFAVAAAAILEWRRPCTSKPEPLELGVVADPALLRKAIQARIDAGTQWAYWQVQNPWWMNVIMGLSLLTLLPGFAVFLLVNDIPLPIRASVVPILIVSAAMIGACLGGLRVHVSGGQLRVRLGFLGVPLLRLRAGDIEDASLLEFSPLADFGGWGIRRGKGMWAYFFEGTRGVVIRKRNGKKYMIGSNNPEELLAVITAVLT